MPADTEDQQRAKLHAMARENAGLLPLDLDIERLMECLAKVQCLCHGAVIDGLGRMFDEGRAIDMAPFYELSPDFVPFCKGEIDFEALFDSVNEALSHHAPATVSRTAPAIALRQLLDSGVLNGCGEDDSPGTWPLPLELFEKFSAGQEKVTSFTDTVGYSMSHVLDCLPDATLAALPHFQARILWSAVSRLEAYRLAPLLKRGFDPDLMACRDTLDVNALHHIASTGHLECARLLLAHGAVRSINTQDSEGCTPIHYAVMNCEHEMVELLIQHGARTRVAMPERISGSFLPLKGSSLLHLAVWNGDIETIQILLKHGMAAYIDTPYAKGKTPVAIALQSRNWEILRYLLDQPVSPPDDARKLLGVEPLTHALPHVLLHNELHGKRRTALLEQRFAAKTNNPPAYAARRLAIMAMPAMTTDQQRAKLRAMTDIRAGLLPHDLDIDRLLACPIKAQCICDNIEAIGTMHDHGMKIEMEPFHAVAEQFVPFHNGQIDFEPLLTAIHVLLGPLEEAAEENPEALRQHTDHPTMVALRQLLSSGLFNSHPDQLFPLYFCTTGFDHAYGPDQLAAVIANTPDTVLRTMGDEENGSLLLLACARNNLTIAEPLIRRGIHCNRPDAQWETPLRYAVLNRNLQLVELLLANGATRSIDAVPAAKLPLFAAVINNMLPIAELLLKHGAQQDADFGLGTPLHMAAREGYAGMARLLLQHGDISYIKKVNRRGNTVLHRAAETGDRATLEALLEHGGASCIDVRNNDGGKMPLMLAVEGGHTEAVALLLKHVKADRLEHQSYGATVMATAESQGSYAIIRLLKNAGALDKDHRPPIQRASAVELDHDWGLLQEKDGVLVVDRARLDQARARIEAHDTGRSFLRAIRCNDEKTVRKLLKHPAGTDLIHHADEYGITPIHAAAFQQNASIVRLLIEKGADLYLETATGHGEKPAHIAARLGHTAVLEALLCHAPHEQVHATMDAQTPLHLAVGYGHHDAAEILLEKGAQVDKKGPFLRTPLMHAASMNDERMVDLLLKYHVQPEQIKAVDGGRKTALMLAEEAKASPRIIEKLRQWERHGSA